MQSYTLPSEYLFPPRKFKNIELLRFLMAWSIVGFHVHYANWLTAYGVKFLRDYTGLGWLPVQYFFVVSFFFLVLKTRQDCSVWKFVSNKWLRMAPLIIVVTLIAYVLYLYGGFWEKRLMSVSANIEQFLLIHDKCPADRWSKFVDPAWFCSTLFLSSILYLSWVKTLLAKHVALIVTSTAFTGLVLSRILHQLPLSEKLTGFITYGDVFTTLGISYVLATVFVITLPQQLGKDVSSIICKSFIMDSRRNHLLESFRVLTLWRALVQTLAAPECNLFCMPVLSLYSEGGLPVPFAGAGLVRLARVLCVWHFHRPQTCHPGLQTHSFAWTPRMGGYSSVVSSRKHGRSNHAFGNAWLPLHRSTDYALH